MSSSFNITLDTTGVASPQILLEGGAQYATAQLINATISCGDGVTTGYQMKLWGDVDLTQNPNIQATEELSAWITYNTTQQIKLSEGDGLKTIYLKVRDDVYNPSSQTSDDINLDSTLPIVSIVGPDVTKVSKQAGKNVASFSFQADSSFVEYKVKYVAASGNAHDTGVLIPTTAGSTNMSGNAGNYAANTPIECQINGADLETASSGDGQKIIKVFVLDDAGNWSV